MRQITPKAKVHHKSLEHVHCDMRGFFMAGVFIHCGQGSGLCEARLRRIGCTCGVYTPRERAIGQELELTLQERGEFDACAGPLGCLRPAIVRG